MDEHDVKIDQVFKQPNGIDFWCNHHISTKVVEKASQHVLLHISIDAISVLSPNLSLSNRHRYLLSINLLNCFSFAFVIHVS